MQWNATTEKLVVTVVGVAIMALSQWPPMAAVSTGMLMVASGLLTATHVKSADERHAAREAKRSSRPPAP